MSGFDAAQQECSGGNTVRAIFLCLAIVVTSLALHLLSLAPPPPAPTNADPDTFSAERAWADIEQIAAQPRPLGSSANRKTAAFLKGRLEQLGAQVDQEGLRDRISVVSGGQLILGASIENVIGRFPASSPPDDSNLGSIVLMAHHDANTMSPGAGDNAMGVAVLLEVARVVSGRDLKREVIVLFTDGEEEGLLGAREFFESHAWGRNVALVINADSRGNAGPVRLVQTSAGNANLIALYGRSVSSPHANAAIDLFGSASPEITDLGVPLSMGISSMNFAALGSIFDYTSASDRAENLSLATVQDMGGQILAVVFGASETTDLSSANAASFFDFFSLTLIQYPAFVDWVLLALGWLFLVAGSAQSVRQGDANIKALGGTAVSQLGILVLAALAAFAIATALGANQDFTDPFDGRRYLINWHLFAIPITLLVVAVCVLPMAIWPNLRVAWWVAGLIWTGCASLLLQMASPGAGYFLAIPFFVSSLIFLISTFNHRSKTGQSLSGLFVATLLAAICLIPVIVAYHTLIGLFFAPVTAVFIVFLFWAIQPVANTSGHRKLGLPIVLVAAAIGSGAFIYSITDYSERYPESTDILFVQNERQGFWASRFPVPDDWSRSLLGTSPQTLEFGVKPYGPRTELFGRPAEFSLPEPVNVEAVWQTGDDAAGDGKTQVTFSLLPEAQGYRVWLKIDGLPNETRATLNDMQLDLALKDNALFMDYRALPNDGLDLRLSFPTHTEPSRLSMHIVSAISGLPSAEISNRPDLPSNKMPIAGQTESWMTAHRQMLNFQPRTASIDGEDD